MLFSPEPKTRREDLYDFNRELSRLVTALRAERLTLVTGLRRTGKTSLLRVALGEAGVTHLYVDVRLSLYAGYRDIAEVFARSPRGPPQEGALACRQAEGGPQGPGRPRGLPGPAGRQGDLQG
jgi:hypothetical protein